MFNVFVRVTNYGGGLQKGFYFSSEVSAVFSCWDTACYSLIVRELDKDACTTIGHGVCCLSVSVGMDPCFLWITFSYHGEGQGLLHLVVLFITGHEIGYCGVDLYVRLVCHPEFW